MIVILWYLTSILLYVQVLLGFFLNSDYDSATTCAAILAYIAAVLSKK